MTLEIDTERYSSPNYNSRGGKPISMIVLHTTEGSFAGDAEWMCSEVSGVSCHYLIAPGGAVYQLVGDEMRAWHAGEGSWHGIYDANSYSIGIEISHQQGHSYGMLQWEVTAELCRMLISRYGIIQSMICAHRWYATPPGRKTDPTDITDRDLQAWIAGLYDAYGVYRNATIDMLNVRQGPGTQYPVALDGMAQLAPGQQFEVDDMTPSDDPAYPDGWLHTLAGIGFVYSRYCERVS
jgi:hypothetical protein